MNLDSSYANILLSSRSNEFSKEHLLRALGQAVYRQTDLQFIKRVVEAGCPVESPRGRSECSPLRKAVSGDNAIAARYLIEKGANVDRLNTYGATYLLHAVFHGSVQVLSVLLEKAADYRMTDTSGFSILHCAACPKETNVNVLRLLRDTGLVGLNIHAKDKYGHTAIEILHFRKNASEEYRQAFYELLRSIKAPEPPSFGPYPASEQIPGAWPED